MTTITEVQSVLNKIVKFGIKRSVFIWGPPGIGKSSIVDQVAKNNDLQLIDLRVSQLAPTDLRGVPEVKDNVTFFAPPSFLPRDGKGILFVDEFNMASPSMMQIAQQLILDRKVGDYELPEDWFIFAAGNRAEDRAAVSQMPAPVANRFIHFEVEHDLSSWKKHAIETGVNEQILSFINYRPQLLFNFIKTAKAWPSPRSWSFANDLLNIGLRIDAAVGEGTASEFYAYQSIYSKLPDIKAIIEGGEVQVPKEPSLMYAICGAMISRSKTAENFFNGVKWLTKGSTEDYSGLFLSDAFIAVETLGIQGPFVRALSQDPDVMKLFQKVRSWKEG